MKFLITSLFLLFITMSEAQNLDDYQWKNRILIISESAIDNPVFRSQLQALKGLESELEERKIIVYQVMIDRYKVGLYSDIQWLDITDPKLFSIVQDTENEFQVVLIGLDGSIKKQQSTIMKSEDLFDTIDSMPMRRNEMNKKKIK